MIDSAKLATLTGSTVRSQDDHKIGKIEDVYEAVEGSDGTFVTVATGLFGRKHSFVPLRNARLDGDDVVVPYDKDLIHDAPRVEADEDLTEAEEDRIYSHYGLETTTAATATTATTAPTETAAPAAAAATYEPGDAELAAASVGANTTAPASAAALDDDSITLSEERLRVGTRRTESGRARLRKYVTTETQTHTVPVSHEELVVEREPISAGTATSAELSEGVREVVLTEEVPVVAKETVPVERVRVGTQTVTDEVTVTEDVSKENIDIEQAKQR